MAYLTAARAMPLSFWKHLAALAAQQHVAATAASQYWLTAERIVVYFR